MYVLILLFTINSIVTFRTTKYNFDYVEETLDELGRDKLQISHRSPDATGIQGLLSSCSQIYRLFFLGR